MPDAPNPALVKQADKLVAAVRMLVDKRIAAAQREATPGARPPGQVRTLEESADDIFKTIVSFVTKRNAQTEDMLLQKLLDLESRVEDVERKLRELER